PAAAGAPAARRTCGHAPPLRRGTPDRIPNARRSHVATGGTGGTQSGPRRTSIAREDGHMNFIIRWLVTAVAVGVAVWLVPGIDLIGGTSAWAGIALFALILSLVNISIRPIMQVLSLPVTVLTLGI